MFKKIALVAVCATFSTAAVAHGFKVGDLEIGHPLAYETPPMAMAGGGFMTITNTGDSADRLIAVRADYPRVEVHETVVTDGVGQMLPVDGIDIPARETVTLQPGCSATIWMRRARQSG